MQFLLAADFANAFLQVLAIVGIILVGGFVIFFLGDLILSILDPNYIRFGRKKKEDKEDTKEQAKQLEAPKEGTKELEFNFEEANASAFAKPDEIIEAPAPVESIKENDNLDDLRVEEEQFRLNMLKSIEERRKQKEEKDNDNEYKEFFFGDEDIDIFNEENALENEEIVAVSAVEEPVIENITEEVVEEPVIEEIIKEKNTQDSIEVVKAEFEAQIAKLQSEKEDLAKKLEAVSNVTAITAGPKLSLNEYEERLNTLKERLSENEKGLRKVKKEFMPLRRVHKTLENDEQKLRRREALVAKQKVVLYGVNNMVDIDQEKAKKLAEDLDLLEGLRLSVQHCEEVMNANKDRYPILENSYEILAKNNEIIKSDIAETEEAIKNLKKDAE